MTTIYLIRHAEAEGNLYRRVQGHYDGAITERGRKQIRALGKRFEGMKFDAVYSSDLTRAAETAAALTPKGIMPRRVKLKELRELNMGEWEDRTWGEVEFEQPEKLRLFSFDPEKWRVSGGETFAQLTERIMGAILRLANEHDGGVIAVVCHGMAIRAFLCEAMGVPSERVHEVPHCDNTAVAVLNVDSGAINIVSRGDNSHLSNGISTFAKQDWWRRDGGTDGRNLRFVKMDLEKETDLYLECYSGAWLASHGRMDGYQPEFYLRYAREHCSEHPASLMKALAGERFAGIVELSAERGKKEGVGWISLIYLLPEARGVGFGAQLLGHAVSVYRALGRRRLRLHVSEENREAIAFYEKHGFAKRGTDTGVIGTLFLMEKSL